MNRFQVGLRLWLAAVPGIIALTPLLAGIIALEKEPPPLPLPVLLIIGTIQSSVLAAAAVFAGVSLAPRVGLHAPLFEGRFPAGWSRAILLPGVLWGILGGAMLFGIAYLFMPLLPPGFHAAAAELSIPWYARLLYGGITEEVLIRWGLMTLIVWIVFRVSKEPRDEAGAPRLKAAYLTGIVVSALAFAALHLPTASAISPVVTGSLVAYVLLANSVFGLIAGYLYWRRGLECAMAAHITAHLTMMLLETLITTPVA